jgi:hypothetical protein
LDDASIIGALNHINDERAAAQERPVTLQCLADAGMGMMWEPRLVVVQDAGTSNGIDCGNVQAFEEAVWHKLTASKAAHRERWQARMNEVEIFANYNNIGDETNAFSMPNCMCCSCRDKSKNP